MRNHAINCGEVCWPTDTTEMEKSNISDRVGEAILWAEMNSVVASEGHEMFDEPNARAPFGATA
jgi:hypothetical protein